MDLSSSSSAGSVSFAPKPKHSSVADFGVGMIAVPSHFFCSLRTECSPRSNEVLIVIFLRVFTFYISGENLVSLVLERYCCCETFEISDFYEAPSNHSNGSNILGNSFHYYLLRLNLVESILPGL